MSRQIVAKLTSLDSSYTLGASLRQLRAARKLPLRSVAAATEIDSTLLSKIELSQRLPTEEQTRAFAAFFEVSFEDMEAKRLAERFWMENGDNPAVHKAVNLLREQTTDYKTKRNADI